ncbi:MAG: J domain-containing protein [Pseudanabaenaceae cyanobacterium]
MADNHYQVLGVNQQAELEEIKQAYRRLAKEFHPDANHNQGDSDRFIAINQAYEILSDPRSRAHYDLQLGINHARPRSPRRPDPHPDNISLWVKQVSDPIFKLLDEVIDPLEEQIEWLSADPFDEELLAVFSKFIDKCRQAHRQAQNYLRNRPNPAPAAAVASHLFHALNAIADGIEELHYFTQNFDDHHLHTAQELWRRAEEMRSYARIAVSKLTGK